MAELRKDPILDRWVIISTERQERPYDFSSPAPARQKGFCPFCHGNEEKTPPELLALRPNGGSPNSPTWSLRVVPNKFPALRVEGEIDRTREGMFEKMNGVGAHEVFIETPDHDVSLEELPQKNIEDCFWAFKERILDLNKDTRFQYILIFKNHGEAAGATLEHCHSQLIALPIVPELIREELHGSKQHYEQMGRCIFCDIIVQEKSDGRRVVSENEKFIAICPFAPRFPFETWVLPKDHSSAFEEYGKEDFPALAQMFKDILLRIRKALDAPPYNFVLHTSPSHQKQCEFYHWHLEIMPKFTLMAGFEQGTGFYINHVSPEYAAEVLRCTQV